MTKYDAWSELALVAVAAQSGTDVPFHAKTETIDIDMGDKDFETMAMVSGGRIVKFTPETETTVTLECYPLEAGSGDISAATSGTGFFDLLHQEDTGQGYQISNSRLRSKYRLAIMWTDSTTTYAAGAITAPTNQALRFVAADGYFISTKPSFTDGILKWTVKFKVPPFDASGNSNIKVESVYSTSTTYTLTALGTYSSTTKWA